LYSHNIQSGLTSNYQKKKTEIKTTKKKSIEIKKIEFWRDNNNNIVEFIIDYFVEDKII